MTLAQRLDARDPEALGRAVEALWRGDVVGVPTETVYGLACRPDRKGALERLLTVKERDAKKGLALLVADLAAVRELAEVPDPAVQLARRFWPGPLTLVLPVRSGAHASGLLTGGRDTLAFRLPDHPVPRALAARLGPLALTSANRSGQPDATTADELLAAVGARIALVLDDGPVAGGVPSTVVLVPRDGSEPRILREGALSSAAILGQAEAAAEGPSGTLPAGRRSAVEAP